MDKVARQLHANGLDLKEIELFLLFIKENNYDMKGLKQDILNSTNSKTLTFFKTKISSKIYTFYILKHSLQQKEDNKYVKIKHDLNCEIMKCPSVKRIIDALKYYKSLYNNNNKNDKIYNQLIIKYFQCKNKYIISDYHHLLSIHLNQTKLIHLQNLEIINDTIYKNKLQCNINQCKQYLRYHRDREKIDDINHIINTENKNNDDICYKVRFYSDLMDTIHCYFIHGFDDGSRLRIRDLTSMKPNIINYDDIKDETSIPYNDDNLKQLQQLLLTPKKLIHKIRGQQRINYNKFNNFIGNNENNNDDDDTEDKKENDDKKVNENNCCIGLKFYYWSYYKNKIDEDTIYHPGFKFSDWFINKKYDNFKQEMLSNKIHSINLKLFNYVLYKSTNLIKQSDHIQSIKSSLVPTYGIQEDYKITAENVMALIFYTDFDKLRNDFAQTFKKLSSVETNQEIKERNREFWFLSKKLHETVECYGTQLIDEKLQIFYVNINNDYLYFNNNLLYFCLPISPTPHMEIATIYLKNESLLFELCPNNYSLTFFNCSFISSFATEQEFLFFGGRKPLQIHSIINLNDKNENYRVFIKSIDIFNKFINGKVLNKQILNVTNMDYFIINCLSKNTKNTFPKYINNLFQSFVNNQKSININLRNIETYYPGFSVTFISSKCDNLIKCQLITKLFKNCQSINVDMTDYGDITSDYISILQKSIDKINKNENTKLEKIVLKGVNLKCSNSALNTLKELLVEKGWIITTQINKNDTLNISITKS